MRLWLCALLAVLLVIPCVHALPVGGADVVWIAAGWFTFGAEEADLAAARRQCVRERSVLGLRLHPCASEQAFAHELPAQRVFVSGFGIDRYEVSQAEHARCLEAGACDPSSYLTDHPGLRGADLPAIGLDYAQATRLCHFRGGRVPTEAEWERAARGDSVRRYPWGVFYNPGLANHGAPSSHADTGLGEPDAGDGYAYLAPVWAFAEARSPHGLVQAAGNVWEWTADAFAGVRPAPLRVDPQVALDNGERVVRGGSFRAPGLALRVTHREARAESKGFIDVGVRCAYALRSGSPAQKPP
ncbi:MAG TPA: SUMF1/EgtB/PvdO family nonheme iron enzyme [Polyangiales bacterium]